MKRLWNSFKICFAMFSKIPMPQSDWSKENMEYMMLFFPLIGTVIGTLLYITAFLFSKAGIENNNLFRCAVLTRLPLFLTGGIHLDGFLDVSDAMSSWQSRERRIEILKDPHAGAFAIIRGMMFILIYVGAVSILEPKTFLFLIPAFTMNRALISYFVVSWRKFSKDGTVSTFSKNAATKKIQISSWILFGLSFAWCGYLRWDLAIWILIVLVLLTLYFKKMSDKYFGGINGDLSGWFNVVSEVSMLVVLAMVTIIQGGVLWN